MNNWKAIVIGQLRDIVSSKILDSSDVYNVKLDIVLSCSIESLIQEARSMIDEYLLDVCNYNIIYACDNNFFEYPGILQLYKRGCENPDAICLYLHTKGMSFHQNIGRERCEKLLTHNILHSWEQTVAILNGNENIKKATIACSREGWGWFNFYWVKGSYLAKCQEPIKSDDRYYYEAWVGRYGSNTYEDCYNMISLDTKHYEPHDAVMLLDSLKTWF